MPGPYDNLRPFVRALPCPHANLSPSPLIIENIPTCAKTDQPVLPTAPNSLPSPLAQTKTPRRASLELPPPAAHDATLGHSLDRAD